MRIHTVQLARSKNLDVPVIDVTVKSAEGKARLVAPTWDMVRGHKSGKIDDETYTKLYMEILEQNEQRILDAFAFYSTLTQKLALACYCRPGAFCHRVLLANWLAEKLGWEYAGEIET
jgi:uncharacterized protein YeaO (DUF488 family)